MLEGLAAWVLNSFLGEYVENLNTDQLSIGVVSGQVELENLPLKKDALKQLDLPLEVKSGFIGCIKLVVPWRHLKSQPWVITLERLYLVAGPVSKRAYDEEGEKKASQAAKDAQLESLANMWKIQKDTTQNDSYSWWSYGTSMMTNILENLQLEVKNIHLRYEDDQTLPGNPFACGVTIKSLSAKSTDKDWIPQFVSQQTSDMMHKLLDLQNFNVYWDTDAALTIPSDREITMAELEDILNRGMAVAASSGNFKDHNCILKPVSAQARMKRNTSPLPLRGPKADPRITLDIQLDRFLVSLGQDQYRSMVAWSQEFRRYDRGKHYRRWRPQTEVHKDAKIWWKFAIDATLHFIHQRNQSYTKESLLHFAKTNTDYVEAYSTLLINGEKYTDFSRKKRMKEVEEELEFQHLRILRSIAHERCREELEEKARTEAPGSSQQTLGNQDAEAAQGRGMLQGWFSGWSGWYGSTSGQSDPQATDNTDSEMVDNISMEESGEPPTKVIKTEIDQEIMDVLGETRENNTLLKRDTVFVVLNFGLQFGTFCLSSSSQISNKEDEESKVLLELECSVIKMELESRPRNHGLKFGVSVGGLFLRDKMTPNSILPTLISPQKKPEQGSAFSSRYFGSLLSGVGRGGESGNYLRPGQNIPLTSPTPKDKLFDLVYDKNPLHSKADFRLCIKTQPLDIVYNPKAISRVKEFFSLDSYTGTSSKISEIDLLRTAQTRYEELKEQTKAELKETWDKLLEADNTIRAKRWDFQVDISTPQIILPETFQHTTGMLVVFDLGRLEFHTEALDLQLQKDTPSDSTFDDEDDFVTPSSTPPDEDLKKDISEEVADPKLVELLASEPSETALHEKIYDKYTLRLSDLQVMVGQTKDSWKYAHQRGTSPFHVIDKFSISTQFERRLFYTMDPKWPKATLSGTLPNLTLHVNEQKIKALQICLDILTDKSTPKDMSYVPTNVDSSSGHLLREGKNVDNLPKMMAEKQEAAAEALLMLMQFSINQVSLEVQSRDRSVVELQVAGVKATFTKKMYELSAGCTVHSMLVVDAVQTFGRDFDLLVASHRNLCLDSQSGSIRGSGANSPRDSLASMPSPTSPSSPAEPVRPSLPGLKTSFQTVESQLKYWMSSTTDDVSPSSSLNFPPKSPTDSESQSSLPLNFSSTQLPVHQDSEALIKIELDMISSNSLMGYNRDAVNIANIQFNNLDFIANQATLVELLTFLQRISPSKKTVKKAQYKESAVQENAMLQHKKTEKKDSHWEVTADFHRLNVLLMRVDSSKLARKVSTATMLEAHISATMSNDDIELKGSLGGLELLDLTTESELHRKVFSVGLEGDESGVQDGFITQLRYPDMYQTAHETTLDELSSDKAFTFTFTKPGNDHSGISSPDQIFSPSPASHFRSSEFLSTETCLVLRMASVCYIHSPPFLKDLSLCVTDFKEYTAMIGSSIKTAAQEVALGFVKKMSDHSSIYDSNISLSNIESFQRLDSTSRENLEDIIDKDDMQDEIISNIKIDAVLQTPIVIIPRVPNSPHVLVAHLGQITLNNVNPNELCGVQSSSTFNMNSSLSNTLPQSAQEKVFVEVKNMSVFSKNLHEQNTSHDVPINVTTGKKSFGKMDAHLGVSREATSILHDTTLELNLEKVYKSSLETCNKMEDIDLLSGIPRKSPSRNLSDVEKWLHVEGRMVTPLKLSLSKQVYEQILQTLDHIALPDDDIVAKDASTIQSNASLAHIAEESNGNSLHSSVSALKLEESGNAGISISDQPAEDILKPVDKPLLVYGHFDLPHISICLTGNLGGSEDQGLVDISLQDFQVSFERADAHTKSFEVFLQSLLMEDLLQQPDSKHRHLMASALVDGKRSSRFEEQLHKQQLSTSCPISMIDIEVPDMPRSLPNSFVQENVFMVNARKISSSTGHGKVKQSQSVGCCPRTPPPSLQQSRRESVTEERLVHIKVLLVDKKSPEFSSKYKRTNRFVDVDFNRLDTTINLQTWVVLLDFLGMGAKIHDAEQFGQIIDDLPEECQGFPTIPVEEKEEVNMEVNVAVHSLSLTLNKPEYELVLATVSNVACKVDLRDGNFAIKGELGNLLVQDISPHGEMFRERFITTGSQALDFDISKYGKPDPDLTRPYDIQVKIHMSSVRYVHTHRFVQETLSFCQHFLQLQEVLGRIRAASAGKQITERAFRGARVSLNIATGAPVLLIPHSSRSKDVLVLNMGTFTLKNSFLFADNPKTNNAKQKKKRFPMSCSEVHMETDDPVDTVQTNLNTSHSAEFSQQYKSGAMVDSVYGSLDDDLRSSELSPALLPSLSATAFGAFKPGMANLGVSSLGGFFSAGGCGLSKVTSNIGTSQDEVRPRSRSCVSSSSVDTSPENHICLLDVMNIELMDIDVFSADWTQSGCDLAIDDLEFPSYVVKRTSGKLLREKCKLMLQVERNLEGDISHTVPDFCVHGALSSVHVLVDIQQYKLLKGLLQHNFGEDLENFQTPLMSHLQDPKIQTVLSGDVWNVICIQLELVNVSTELLVAHSSPQTCFQEVSLASIDFLQSKLVYESYSDGMKDIDLVSHEIRASDTRYRGDPVNVRPNVFQDILRPSQEGYKEGSLQLELHFRSSRDRTRFTILLNSMRLIGIFDWLLASKDFLATGVDNPFEDEAVTVRDTDNSSGKGLAGNLTVSPGIFSKRAPVDEDHKKVFELNVNITDTELVVVENSADKDTNAVIVKTTAVLSFCPSKLECPMKCSLQNLEVFSCCLAAEAETALSIIDPVVVMLELNGSPSATHQVTTGPSGLLDATVDQDKLPVLEVSFDALNLQLSYNDMRLFLGIINSMPQQLLQAQQQAPPRNAPEDSRHEWCVVKLEGMGFMREDCEIALATTNGNMDEAALWLTANASPIVEKKSTEGGITISGIEVKAGSICFCLIDDCLDADVPLVELAFTNVYLLHKFHPKADGHAALKLATDYYNRDLSGWEPLIENWSCRLRWNQGMPEENHLIFHIEDSGLPEVLNINLTGTIMELYENTKNKWTEDYNKLKASSEERGDNACSSHRRVPFIPFSLRNETGCPMKFTTVTTTVSRLAENARFNNQTMTERSWNNVGLEQELPFQFEEREKFRYKHSHELRVHQLIVKVKGWQEVAPVSVDKVGVYFRQTLPDDAPPTTLKMERQPARLVFSVKRVGSARKQITVRSALQIRNQLEHKTEIKLDIFQQGYGHGKVLTVDAGSSLSVPLPLVHSRIFLRPSGWSLNWCKDPVNWQRVTEPGDHLNISGTCDTIAGGENTYRFGVSVYRQYFPKIQLEQDPGRVVQYQPGHVLTIVPPVRVENLLPIDITYYFRNTDICRVLKPGVRQPVISLDLSSAVEFGVKLENFSHCQEVYVMADDYEIPLRLVLTDLAGRSMELLVSIRKGVGGAIKISVSIPYWLVNKSGLPLVFRDDSESKVAAGQFEVHEQARSMTPLPFSFANADRHLCTMRLGKSYHKPNMSCRWSSRFMLERGIAMREIHVMPPDNRPDLVYNIGIEVRQGRGRYSGTNIVTFAPRYQLDNSSCHKLGFAQQYAVLSGEVSLNMEVLHIPPTGKLAYHWPRVDLDPLLCVKIMDDKNNQWSGGIRVDRVDSFHINMRDGDGQCMFLRADVVLQGATYFVVFTDADSMPPPYRLDNLAHVAVTYFQTSVQDERLRTEIKPHTSVDYAWDEPTLDPHITLNVHGGSSATYNLNTIREGDQLFYENFIYIAFTGTFKGLGDMERSSSYSTFIETQKLVLDVDPPGRVVLRRKEVGKRSQMWRMTMIGMLAHEGTTSPREPSYSSRRVSSQTTSSTYVLDIQDPAFSPDKEQPLVLRKPDESRRTTQHWSFTNDGRLCCRYSSALCVQAQGQMGLREGSAVVVAAGLPKMLQGRESTPPPIEMSVSCQKQKPGSGQLGVKVLTDGPTRVLRIVDAKQQPPNESSLGENGVRSIQHQKKEKKKKRLEIYLHLSSGIGLSLVNQISEELVYVSLRGINIQYSATESLIQTTASLASIQIDNQLFGTYRPVLLFVTPPKGDNPTQSGPAIRFSMCKMVEDQWNADIYKYLELVLPKMTVQIEERLLWKLLQFAGMNTVSSIDSMDENSFETQRALTAATSTHFKRYYFGILRIVTARITLSMFTADSLPADLRVIKKATGIPLVKFEEAKVELDPFVQEHPFETSAFLLESLKLHYKDEMMSQSVKILGSVDFLGNPIGLFSDVAEGVSGLIQHGNVGGLLKNVTHGISDSAAKFTGSASDAMGVATLDSDHEKTRQRIRNETSGSGLSTFKAGVKGFGHGLWGGLSSVVTQTYTGAREDGVEGFAKGVFKGAIGTVTKPVAGILDLAAGTAGAVRDTSKGSGRKVPGKVRKSRCCHSRARLLPQYDKEQADAQESLYKLNKNDYDEIFLSNEMLRSGSEDSMRALISGKQVYFLGREEKVARKNILLSVTYSQMYHCRHLEKDQRHYVEMVRKPESERATMSEEPRMQSLIRCDRQETAEKVAEQINYAKSLYDEKQLTLPEDKYLETD